MGDVGVQRSECVVLPTLYVRLCTISGKDILFHAAKLLYVKCVQNSYALRLRPHRRRVVDVPWHNGAVAQYNIYHFQTDHIVVTAVTTRYSISGMCSCDQLSECSNTSRTWLVLQRVQHVFYV